MKNLIQKSAVIFFSSFLLLSCSKDNTDETKPVFFNLKVGNTWVYKEYDGNDKQQVEPSFTGVLDTVKIVSIENIQGLTFAKKSTKKVNINSGEIYQTTYNFVRVNNLGHLVEISDNDPSTLTETSGLVLHPGFDTSFSYNRIVSFDSSGETKVYGNIEFHVDKPVNMVVEGNNYLVSPYIGAFTPSPEYPDLVSKTSPEYYYSQNIGLVKSVARTLVGNGIVEERLVSYKLN